jgi:hypothetical protein
VFVAPEPAEQSVSQLLGPLEPTGLKPSFLRKLATNGVILRPELFA